MTRLDLIKFTTRDGKPCKEYGLQEVSEDGKLLRLYDNEADQFSSYPNASFKFVRTLGTMDDSDDFWNLVAECKQINPQS